MTNFTSTAEDTDQIPKNNFKAGLPKQKNSFLSALTGPETGPKPSIYFLLVCIFVSTVVVACIHVDLFSFFDIAKGETIFVNFIWNLGKSAKCLIIRCLK